MKHYPYLIKGGTALAVGLAAALAEKKIPALIFDKGSNIAGEFAAAFQGTPMFPCQPVSEYGKMVKKELLSRNILSENGDCLGAVEPVYCKLLNDLHGTADFIANARAISHTVENGRHYMELFTIGGVYGFTGDIYIDTTAEEEPILSQKLNAALVSSVTASDNSNDTLFPGRFAGEVYFSIPADGMTYTEARTALLTAWRNRGSELREAGLLYIADRFAQTCAAGLRQRGVNQYSIPSVGYGSALEALEAGYLLSDKLPEVTV